MGFPPLRGDRVFRGSVRVNLWICVKFLNPSREPIGVPTRPVGGSLFSFPGVQRYSVVMYHCVLNTLEIECDKDSCPVLDNK